MVLIFLVVDSFNYPFLA